ncbi:MAG: hypothetical protein JOZ64_07295, partial [Solirubrobacterales bacterium]|nr:hypothetical protein [Solirubrobacterales bacterium]
QLTGTQSQVSNQLVESYDAATGQVTDVAEETTSLAKRAGAEVVEGSHDAAVSASRTQRKARTQATRRTNRTRSKSASRSTPQPGPARWTREAYESLTAAEINEKLPQLSQRDLGEVERYETAHQSRQTVLDRINALRGQEPVPGYDELNVQDIQKLLAEHDDQVAASVRDYERPRKNRDTVLQAADSKLSKS